jgi:hypothetical protein
LSSESVKGESVVVQVSLRKAVPILPIFKKIIEGCCAASRRAVKL